MSEAYTFSRCSSVKANCRIVVSMLVDCLSSRGAAAARPASMAPAAVEVNFMLRARECFISVANE